VNHECFAGLQCAAARRVGIGILLMAATMLGLQAEEVPSAPAAITDRKSNQQPHPPEARQPTENEPRRVDEPGCHLRVQAVRSLMSGAGRDSVVTQDEIRRSGASSIPEALRFGGQS